MSISYKNFQVKLFQITRFISAGVAQNHANGGLNDNYIVNSGNQANKKFIKVTTFKNSFDLGSG